MEINVEKSKVTAISREKRGVRILIDGKELEQVDHFKYLGSILTTSGECTKKIRARIAQATVAFNRKRTLFTEKIDIILNQRKN